ncbi:hypothetical protein LIER_34911 [Lithospermum erythrorhizon]|uniref:Uncharacterized protein n=1 Tax=Lithospermum erythrorhizon TaxID=34254 RepID=A0AAV3NH79_LITER
MDDLLRECEVANPIVFVNEPYANDDEDVIVQFIATDRSSHHNDSLSGTSSSEDDEPATDPSVISASDSGSNHVS